MVVVLAVGEFEHLKAMEAATSSAAVDRGFDKPESGKIAVTVINHMATRC